MVMAEDLYQALGLGRDATKDEIQKAYRKLARKYHPDMNPGDEKAKENFKRIQEAYDVLSDPEKRSAYDRYGADFEQIRQGGWRPGAGAGASFDGLDLEQIFGGRGGPAGGFEGGFAEFFEQLAGGARGGRGGPRTHRAAPVRGSNVQHELTIPLRTAVSGGKAEFYLDRGKGSEKISVTIPPGVTDGSKIRLRGQGQPSPTGHEAGDLILTLKVSSHPHFQRSGQNLLLTLPVTLAEAALGAKVDIPTPSGTITLSIPPGSSSGRRLRVKGRGVGSRDGSVGDLLVDLEIKLPETISEEGQEAIREFDRRHPMTLRQNLSW